MREEERDGCFVMRAVDAKVGGASLTRVEGTEFGCCRW